jgi:hypothetical protein
VALNNDKYWDSSSTCQETNYEKLEKKSNDLSEKDIHIFLNEALNIAIAKAKNNITLDQQSLQDQIGIVEDLVKETVFFFLEVSSSTVDKFLQKNKVKLYILQNWHPVLNINPDEEYTLIELVFIHKGIDPEINSPTLTYGSQRTEAPGIRQRERRLEFLDETAHCIDIAMRTGKLKVNKGDFDQSTDTRKVILSEFLNWSKISKIGPASRSAERKIPIRRRNHELFKRSKAHILELQVFLTFIVSLWTLIARLRQ